MILLINTQTGAREVVNEGDPAKIADTISSHLRKQLPPVRGGRGVCPKGIKLTEGATFQCPADVAGYQLPVTVTLSHVDTDTGSYEADFKQAKALLDANKVVEEIQLRLPEQAAGATVD